MPQCEADVGRIAAMGHPDALLEPRSGERVSPNGYAVLEVKSCQVRIAVRRNGAVGVLIACKLELHSLVARGRIELRDHQGALDGRRQGGNQEGRDSGAYWPGRPCRRQSRRARW